MVLRKIPPPRHISAYFRGMLKPERPVVMGTNRGVQWQGATGSTKGSPYRGLLDMAGQSIHTLQQEGGVSERWKVGEGG